MGSHQQSAKMGEGTGSKQVRVDNWGIFFLQRLQMFFNKTDYCDLTLQFEGNVQLKVHRLVMNACTEYFQVLEHTCEMIDDVLIMPSDLQADVVLPIVNFMYTGMLEFHMSIFDKLYKTANLMNITVLTKLLDAQKTPIAPLPKPTNKRNSHIPHTWNLQGKKIYAKTSDPDLPATLPGRKLPVWKRKSAPIAVPHTIVPHFYPEQKRSVQVDPLAVFDNAPKPTRFEWPEDELSTLNVFDSSFDDISYTSKPLVTQDDEPRPSTSFDRIKDTPDSCRRSASYSNTTVDMEDVKDYVKEQRIRSNMTEDDDDDGIDNDFDSCDISSKTNSSLESQKRKIKLESIPAKRVRFNVNEKENQIRQTKINITPTGKTSSDVDHTKIISEVLKKYPNLVKKNKNIRLKILAKSNNTSVSVEQVKKPILKKAPPKLQLHTVMSSPSTNKAIKTIVEEKNDEDGPWKCQRCSTPTDPLEFVLYYLYRKHMTDVHNEKFDSRMCKFCGHKSTKHNMLMYHQYTKHGVKPPPAYNFPKCSQCPYIALTEALLIRHKTNHTKYELQCVECKVTFTNRGALTSHVQITGHTGKSDKPNYDCQYCTKKFQTGATLFSHIRQQHRDEARRDGIVSIDEGIDGEEEIDTVEQQEEEEEEEDDEYITDKREKIKILSDVKLPSMDIQHSSSDSLEQQNISLEPSSEAEALSNVASGIATSLGLVDVVVLDENQQYILHSDNQQGMASGESEFILPDLQDTQTYTTTQQVITSEQNVITQSMLHNSDIGSTDELVMVLTDHDYGDGNNEMINNENSNIVVLYSHPIEGQENQFITSQGNLMLTSQAGLIELRNGNTVVTSAGPHFITSSAESQDNTHIESIEMIQREINQHPDVKNQIHLVQDIKPALVDEVTNNPVNVATDIQQGPEHLNTTTSESDMEHLAVVEENDSHQLQFNTLEDTTPNEINEIPDREEKLEQTEMVVEQEVTDTNNIEQPLESNTRISELNQEDPELTQVQFNNDENIETREPELPSTECSQSLESNKTEEVQPTEPESFLENMDVQETPEEQLQPSKEIQDEINRPLPETTSAEPTLESNEEITDIQETNPPEETSKEIKHKEEDKVINHTPEELEEELNTTAEEQLNHETVANPQLEEIDELSKPLDENLQEIPMEVQSENTNSIETENIPVNSETDEICQKETNISNDNLSMTVETSLPHPYDTNLELSKETSQLSNENSKPHEEPSQIQEEKIQIQDDPSTIHEQNSEMIKESIQVEDKSSEKHNENPELLEVENSHDEHGQAKDNTQLQEAENSSLAEEENSELHEEETSELHEEKNSQLQEDENSQLQGEELSQLQEEENSELQEESFEENSELHDEKSELNNEHSPLQVENSNLQDDNSQTSHTSTKPTYSRNNSNQSAKIILDDWEDTDSQQSDSKNGTAVHKLIDDWDDDEEEKKSGV